MISLITPTSDRHIAFTRCEYYFERQTYSGKIQWIVVDDGKNPIICTKDQKYIRVKPKYQRGRSIANNYLNAIKYIKGDIIVFWEDDDWYAPEYIEKVIEYIELYQMIGFYQNRYYNIRHKRWWKCGNLRHSSLCSTVIRQSVLPTFKKIAQHTFENGHKFIDLKLWRQPLLKKLIRHKNLVVGMKGLPGKTGIAGHSGVKVQKIYIDDKDLKTLYTWLPEEDADWYAKLF